MAFQTQINKNKPPHNCPKNCGRTASMFIHFCNLCLLHTSKNVPCCWQPLKLLRKKTSTRGAYPFELMFKNNPKQFFHRFSVFFSTVATIFLLQLLCFAWNHYAKKCFQPTTHRFSRRTQLVKRVVFLEPKECQIRTTTNFPQGKVIIDVPGGGFAGFRGLTKLHVGKNSFYPVYRCWEEMRSLSLSLSDKTEVVKAQHSFAKNIFLSFSHFWMPTLKNTISIQFWGPGVSILFFPFSSLLQQHKKTKTKNAIVLLENLSFW